MSNPEGRARVEVGTGQPMRTVDRRRFIRTVGGAAAAAAGLSVSGGALRGGSRPDGPVGKDGDEVHPERAENFVRHLYDSLSEAQRKDVCFPFDHPLSRRVENNWHIVPQTIGEFFTADQQEMIRKILGGITTEEGYERFSRSMKDDDGGLGNYSCALFGKPGEEKFQWVLTGRHVTLRADGNTVANAAFGGPIFYGHAVTFNEKPDHPGNVWWHQARMANDVFQSLDGKQRERALLAEAPPDSSATVKLRGAVEEIPGLRGGELSADQKELLEKTLKGLLGMFRESDVEEVVECLRQNGGLDAARISFYQQGDLGDDGIWDRWRVEGPAFVWYFRGSPHVHTWVNVAHHGPEQI